MKIDFKTLKMMDLRSAPGEVLDRVARDGEVFVVERNGQPKACLVPVSFLLPDISPDRIALELKNLDEQNQEYRLTINDRRELEITIPNLASEKLGPVSIVLPHGYPDTAPRIYALRLPANIPMCWPDGSLAIYGSTAAWNAKADNVSHALGLVRKWFNAFAKWQATQNSNGGPEDHE